MCIFLEQLLFLVRHRCKSFLCNFKLLVWLLLINFCAYASLFRYLVLIKKGAWMFCLMDNCTVVPRYLKVEQLMAPLKDSFFSIIWTVKIIVQKANQFLHTFLVLHAINFINGRLIYDMLIEFEYLFSGQNSIRILSLLDWGRWIFKITETL